VTTALLATSLSRLPTRNTKLLKYPFFIAGLLYLLGFEHVDNLGAYSIPSETGLLIPSVFDNRENVVCPVRVYSRSRYRKARVVSGSSASQPISTLATEVIPA
jgi:hypothetical protein